MVKRGQGIRKSYLYSEEIGNVAVTVKLCKKTESDIPSIVCGISGPRVRGKGTLSRHAIVGLIKVTTGLMSKIRTK